MNVEDLQATTVKVALDRASQELAAMSDCVSRMQQTIPETVGYIGPEIYRELQSLDYLHQHLDQLRIYLDALHILSKPEWTIDINQATVDIQLALMAARLRGIRPASSASHEAAGELQLLSGT
ncbi:MAG: hypothetical protein MUC37_00440 [Hyphomicrobium sp.]|jgi:hypothetical protein|nr:hypothetical protein [Hyphomicrobium sp.]